MKRYCLNNEAKRHKMLLLEMQLDMKEATDKLDTAEDLKVVAGIYRELADITETFDVRIKKELNIKQKENR